MYSPLSLQDIICTNCALRFEEIFFEKDGQKWILKKFISLPPNLFEKFLYKSREMGYKILPTILKSCLAYRDALYWQNIDLSYMGECECPFGKFVDEDLESIANSVLPLNMLTFSTELITDTMMMYISNFSSSLSHLHIGPEGNKSNNVKKSEPKPEHMMRIKEIIKSKIKLPRLKYLRVNFYNFQETAFNMIDFSSFSESLRYLMLTDFDEKFYKDYRFEYYIIQCIGKCKKLVSLSLNGCYFFRPNLLMRSILSLIELQTIDLSCFNPLSEIILDLSGFISKLPKLEKLELYGTSTILINVDNIKGKKLKYIGTMHVSGLRNISIEAESIGNESSIESFLSALMNGNNEYIIKVIYDIHDMIETSVDGITNNQLITLEQGIMRCIYRYPYNCMSYLGPLMELERCRGRWSEGFLNFIKKSIGAKLFSYLPL